MKSTSPVPAESEQPQQGETDSLEKPAEEAAKPMTWGKRLQLGAVWTGRGLLLVSLFALIGLAMDGYQFAFEKPKSEGTRQAPIPAPIPLPMTQLALLEAGGIWELAGDPWQIEAGYLNEPQVEGYLTEEVKPFSGSDASKQSEAKLLELLPQLSLECEPFGEGNRWSYSHPHVKVRIFTQPVDGEDRLVEARCAMFVDEQRWTYLEARPTRPEQRTLVHTGPSFLPLPEETERICVRNDTVGNAVCEWVRVSAELPALVRSWREDGWTVRFQRATQEGHQEIVCFRGNTWLQVWAQRVPKENRLVLFLLKVPTDPAENAAS
ncbi:Hypothetical protein PBC10988_23790 [Planctomycetales bacterium 10988]|nr:Hypothetical protein PBC10988_23790 [Planctomycetales bacterium 10988]